MNDVNWVWPEGPPVPEAVIRKVETELGVTLPESFLNVVRTGDGLRPENEDIVEQRAGEDCAINTFSHIKTFNDGGILRSHEALMSYAEERGRDLIGVVPIASNGDGWICFDYRQDSERKNYKVVDCSLTPLEDADDDGLIFIADSFETLLGMLRAAPK